MKSLPCKPDLQICHTLTIPCSIRPGTHTYPFGLPTLFDQNILIYCTSVAMAEIRRGRPVPEVGRMSAGELLRFTNRRVGGPQHAAVEDGIHLLTTPTLKTNLRGEETTYNRLFGVVDEASMVRRHNRRDCPSALLGCETVLSAWIHEALEARRVLTPERQWFVIEGFQICGRGLDWAFARTDRHIIERAARDWGGIGRPRAGT